MQRLHIHISVENLEQNIHFYSTLFGSQPSVQHDDYAKWMLCYRRHKPATICRRIISKKIRRTAHLQSIFKRFAKMGSHH